MPVQKSRIVEMMSPKITALTPTGARPEAFKECVLQMREQTETAVLWVIVDDGPEPMETPEVPGWDIVHLRVEPYWKPGQNTLARNILAGLPECSDHVAIIEDDDSYQPWWLSACRQRLEMHDLVGESHARYFNRETQNTLDLDNDEHASLCSTAFKGNHAAALLEAICEQSHDSIDIRFWRIFDGPKRLYMPRPRGVLGVKGWPGRPGIGMGHSI